MKKVLVLLAVLAVTGIASAELLTNGDFSGGGGYLWADGWAVWNGGVWADPQVQNQNALKVWTTGGQWDGGGAAQEHIAVTPGVEYTLSADFMVDPLEPVYAGGSVKAIIKFEFYDGTHTLIDQPYGTDVDWLDLTDQTATGVWVPMSGSAIAPAGATELHAVVLIQDQLGTLPAIAAWYDNVSLVPEPATMALLGLGGLLLRRRK